MSLSGKIKYLKSLWVIPLIAPALFISGCATRATANFTESPTGYVISLKCSPHTECSAKNGDNEVSANSKFDVLKNIVNVQKL